MLFSRFVLNLIIVFSQQRKVLRLWCQELPVETFWTVVTLRGMVSTGLTQQPQGTPLECIVTWLLMEVSSNHFHSFQTGWLAFKEQGTRLTYNGAAWHKECEMSHFLASSPKAYIRHQLNIHVMVNWQLSEKSIRWPKSHDSIACSDVKFRVFSKRISPKATSGYNFRT